LLCFPGLPSFPPPLRAFVIDPHVGCWCCGIRGTSTHDGTAIAYATLQYMVRSGCHWHGGGGVSLVSQPSQGTLVCAPRRVPSCPCPFARPVRLHVLCSPNLKMHLGVRVC
jgi:hypothetical protein